MRNASKHAETLKVLQKTLQKEGKPAPLVHVDPLKALVRGAMAYGVSDSRADEAVQAIEREFMNLNELRVATPLEVQEMVGAKYPDIEHRVELITRDMNAIFEREHTLSLDRLKTLSKRDARQFLKELPVMNSFVEAYIMLFGFEGASAVPLDQEMFDYLRGEGLFEEKSTVEEAQRFIESNIKGEAEAYELYAQLRRAAHAASPAPRKKSKA